MKTTIKNTNTNTKLNNLLRVMGLSVILLGILGSLVSCGGAETTTPLEGIQGVATLGDQTTTEVYSGSYQSFDNDDNITIFYAVDVYGLTNERYTSGTQGSLTLTEYSGGNVVKEEIFSFSDPSGIVGSYKYLGEYVSSNDGESYEVSLDFQGNIRGTATFGNQTGYVYSYSSSGTYRINISGFTNEPGESGTQGSLTLTEYSRGNPITSTKETYNFTDPSGEASLYLPLAGFTDSVGASYEVNVIFYERY